MTVRLLARLARVALALILLSQVAHAQLPSVHGFVFQDNNADGLLDQGEELVGASLNLFADDGDGLFNPTVDTLVTTNITDANGQYFFGGLGTTGNYFVEQTAQTVGGVSLLNSVSGLITAGAFNTLIDDFASQQEVTGNPIVPIGATNLTSNSVIGGQRDLHIEYLSGPAESSLYANPFGLNQVLELNQSAAVVSVATVTWDGIDGDTSTTPQAGGLGGIDLTAGGLNGAFSFDLGVDAAGAGETLQLHVYSGSDVATATVVLPVTNGTATTNQVVPFTDFIGTADWTAIDAIQLETGGVNPSIDLQIGPLGLIGPAVHDFAAVPEPSSLLIALFGFTWFWGSRRQSRRNK